MRCCTLLINTSYYNSVISHTCMHSYVLPHTHKHLLVHTNTHTPLRTHTHTLICVPQFWDRSTLQQLKVLKGHKKTVYCLQINKEVIISGSWDHTVKLVHPLPLSTRCTGLFYTLTICINVMRADMTPCS